jgi:hypothetical protein
LNHHWYHPVCKSLWHKWIKDREAKTIQPILTHDVSSSQLHQSTKLVGLHFLALQKG